MASGFVPGGSLEAPVERDEEWRRVEEELEEKRRLKAKEGKEHEGKSLFEVLQANKAAKQEAFEESQKLKHQFQPLNDDDIEFLDSVEQKQRAREKEIKQTADSQLASFRKQKSNVEESITSPEDALIAPTQWSVQGKKRKQPQSKTKELLKGVKIRKTEGIMDKETNDMNIKTTIEATESESNKIIEKSKRPGLIQYSSSDED